MDGYACLRVESRLHLVHSRPTCIFLHDWLAVLLVNVQASFSGYKVMGMEGGRLILSVIYHLPQANAGAVLAARYPKGRETGCLGYDACSLDSYWARYAGVSNSATIEAGY